MRYQVRELSFGEILDQAFNLLRDNFVLLTSIMAVIYVPFSVINALLQPRVEQGVPTVPDLSSMMMLLGAVLLMLMFAPLAQLAGTRAVADAYLSTPTSFGQAYASAWSTYGRYLLTMTLVGLAVFASMFLLVVPAVYLIVCWLLVGPLAVVEGVFGRAAMKRSRALVRGNWWRVFGVVFVAGVVSGMVSAGLSLLLSAIPFLGGLLNGLVQSVTAAFGSAAIVVLYVDLRCRKEDFDLTLLANSVGGAASPVPSATAPART